ncbi:MAG TPA: TonB-dependent receptor [Steroidobacteraceae bacterium]|nr:TonB-dependent receptor [Steroidobacteraceae bacterium]
MTRSRLRKLRRQEAKRIRQTLWKAAPVAGALLSCMSAARAADDDTASMGLAEVVVTAQKRVENLQDVPLSIQAIGTKKLEEMNVTKFDDYAQLLPSVSFQSTGPSVEHVYMRGVASGGDGNHSGSLPSVGMYLDEQPVTTIDGNLNIHIYDIARVEALSGPQGTLYGASSEAGTLRIITNKPDPTKFAAGYDLEGNTVDHGGNGYSVEGFVNIPITSFAAVRLVGWDVKDAGYIDNVPGSVTFPTSGITMTNTNQVKNNYNDVDTRGGRAALKIDLNDNWTITPQVMGQVQKTNGSFLYNPALGDLELQHYFPDTVHDSWVQSALTVEGRISNFDLVYSGAYLTRNTHESSDYTDYSLAYDQLHGSGVYFLDNAGNFINPAQHIIGKDHYTKTSHEFRISTPKDYPLRATAGFFLQRQVHEIEQNYVVANDGTQLADDLSVPGWPGSVWLTEQERVDRDKAVFTELSYDLLSNLTLNAGIRYYTFDNTLQGYYGFNGNFSGSQGTATCYNDIPFHGAPCSDLNGRSTGSGNTPKVNLQYKIDRDRMVYATWSKGFRPGGVNRNGGGTIPPYKPDYLTNYELGWKTAWLDNRLRWNGALFYEKWKDFQFSYLGPNALTIIANAGEASIKGVESDFEFQVMTGLTVTGGFAYLDAKLTQEFAPIDDTTGEVDPTLFAPKGERLPVTPKFKGNLTARYTVEIGNGFLAHVQATGLYVGERFGDLRQEARAILGPEPSYFQADFAVGAERNGLTGELYIDNAFDRRAVLDRSAECDEATCGTVALYNTPSRPRTIGIRFGQRF